MYCEIYWDTRCICVLNVSYIWLFLFCSASWIDLIREDPLLSCDTDDIKFEVSFPWLCVLIVWMVISYIILFLVLITLTLWISGSRSWFTPSVACFSILSCRYSRSWSFCTFSLWNFLWIASSFSLSMLRRWGS